MKRVLRQRLGEPSGYLFIAPFYLVFFFFTVVPVITGLMYSFTNYDLYRTCDFVGLLNYRQLLGDRLFRLSVVNTVRYAVLYIIPVMVLGLSIATLLNGSLFGTKFYRTSLYLPNMISMVAASMIWLWLYDPALGFLNQLLQALGLSPHHWLRDPNMALYCIIVMSVWKNLGHTMIIYLAGLQAIPRYLYEAATVDGAGTFKQFVYITLPMLRPTTFFIFITTCISAFNIFEQVNVLTGGGPVNSTTTIVHQIYVRAFTEFRMGYASAIAMVLVAIMSIITLVNFRYGNQGQDLDIG